MKNSYRFYTNRECTYFPCHKLENMEEFNCMFCYCPLYFIEDCGGNYDRSNGFKDCTNCTIPHVPKGYDYINEKLVKEFKAMRQKNGIGKL